MGAAETAPGKIGAKRRQRNIQHHAHELTFSVYHGRPWLRDPSSARMFLAALDRARGRLEFDLFAYVVMPEHCHVLVCPRREEYDIGEILKAIKSPCAKEILRSKPELRPACRVTRPGRPDEYRFWQPGGGYDRNIFKSKTIWQVIDYIHANPVRRALAEEAEHWPWSSASAYGGGQKPIPVDICPWMDELGKPYKLEKF